MIGKFENMMLYIQVMVGNDTFIAERVLQNSRQTLFSKPDQNLGRFQGLFMAKSNLGLLKVSSQT